MKSSTFNGYPVHLIETVDELLSLKRIFSPKIRAGLDTETSSLEYKADQIAGVCVSGGVDYSPQGYAGYYIPLRHIGYGANLPVEVVRDFIQWLIDNFQTVLFNRNFDTSMLEYDGVKIPFVGGMHDAQIMAYSVFNEAYPSLKDYSRRFLKWDMIDFAENKAKDHNFKTTDPTVSYIYAAGDPIATVFLARKLWSTYPYIRRIYKIDNYCLEAVRRLCQNELTLDYDFLEALRDDTERHLAEIRTKIYSMSGVYGFNIDSSREKADVLSRFVTLTEKTKSGKFKTDEEALRRLNHPIANLMIDYAQTRVFLKSFVAKMCTYKGRVIRANYNTVNVPSGRLSSGASEGNPYFVPQNMQNCPKEEEKLFLHHHPSLGYFLDREEEGCVRNAKGEPVKYKTKTGLHRAFIPHDKDWVIMSSDYAAQELRLAANFSRDPNFLEPLLKGDDIHMHVAKQMFGYEDPLHRTKVKIVNFCLGEDSYVMTDSGIVRPASLKGDERLLKVFGGTQSYQMEVRLSDTVKVHYSNGVVEEYDSRHQVAVTSDKGLTWKRVCDLTEDDEVLISVGRMKETSSPLIERVGTYRKFSVSREKEYNLSTKEFAYLAGLYLGDGHISLGKQGRPNSVSWVAEEQIYPLVEECLTKLGLKWSIHTYEGKNYRLYRVHSSQFARVLCKHFGRTKTKTISDEVLLAWGKDLFIPLCQGLVDSDGTLHGNVLVYFTCLDELAKKVALVLSGLGIYVRERVADHNCHQLRMSENDVVQSNLDRKRWGSGRPLLDFRKYDRSILEGLPGGFENGRVDNMRRGKCGLWVKSSLVEKAGYSGLRPVSVVSVSKPRTGKIYVIETETGSYISSSVVSHNSALYGAEYPTVSARLGIPLQEGKTLMTRYKQTMSKLYAWKAEIVKAAKKRGYALTYFGRPVYLLKYFNSPDRGMSAYAERLAVNATIQGPVTPDTPVLLEDGYRLMKDVPDQGICATGKGFARYVKVFSGVQPIVELEFEDGSTLKCSKSHRLLSVQSYGLQWMEASEIVEGTPIASHLSLVEGTPVLFDLLDQGIRAVRVSSEINNRVEETFYWIGRAFGDGSFLESGVIHWVFGTHERDDRDRLVKWGNALGLHVNLQEFSKKDKSRMGDCLRATISSKNLCKLLKQIGVRFGVTSHDKRIPSRVFTASFEQKRQFVKGLFDSDGSKNWGWGWHMCNGDLLHDLQTLLLSMGVFSRWHKCKDAYILNITSLKEFALLVGRERSVSKCQQSRMLVPDFMASKFIDKYLSGELRYFRKGILSTDRTIIYKLRNRHPVGYLKFVELCARFGWDVWKEDDFYFYKKVKSVRSLGESEVYCLSVEDPSHQFITNGVVSHNCILADTYVPSQDGKTISTMRSHAGQRVQFAKDERGTAHKGVPVFRGKLPCAMVEFLSGDFIMVSTNHKFLKYKSNTLLSIEDAAADAVQFVKPHKKVKLFKAILNTLLGRFKGTTLNSLAVFPRHDKPADSVEIATALFRAFARDEHLITYNPVLAHSVRSLVDLYGYNLVKVCSGRYALSWSRAKKSKVCFVDNLKGTYDVMSPTMISGFQTYPLSGMIHKNTGADLMRLFLIKFTKLNIDDKDWRENTRMILPVHDEMNLEVSIPYMREAWLKMRKVMNFFPENFAVPIVVDTGVGTSWGNCLDVECISPKGRVVPKDIDPDDFSGEERAYLQEILEECVFEELPDRLKKFVKC